MIYILIIFSFLFESLITNIVNIESFLVPLFLLTSLCILYPFFKSNNLTFFITSTICGFIYDISFTDTLFINTISFGACSGIIILLYNYFKYNIYSASFINVISIISYRTISYLLLCIIDYINFNHVIFFKGIYNSLLINIIYGIILYLTADILSRLFNIKMHKN